MKEIEQMKAGKIYLIESMASANSVYFETDYVAKLFFRYCDYYLKDYLNVEEYVLNKNGWAMLIKVKSVPTIRKNYELLESARKKKNEQKQKSSKAIWKILSERVRLFISTYVRMSNKVLGREGSLVRRKYGRYEFDTLFEAKGYVAKLRNDEHEMQQQEEKYRGFDEHFRLSGNILTNPLRSSLWVESSRVRDRILDEMVKIFGEGMPVLHGIGNLVALKYKSDLSNDTNTKPNPPNP